MLDRPRYVVLDSWRGLAALLVATFHLMAFSHLFSIPFFRHAWLFVDFFFVLSGFVVSHAYADRLRNVTDLEGFVIQRFGRLWPLHVFVLALFIFVELLKAVLLVLGVPGFDRAPFSGDRTPETIIANLFLVHSLGIHGDLSWNRPSWSISVEFFVYLIFAGMMVGLRNPRPWFIGAIVLCVIILGFNPPQYIHGTFDVGLFRGLYGFLVGYFVWLIVRRFEALGPKRSNVLLATITEAVCVVFVVAYVAVVDLEPRNLAAPIVFGITVFAFAFEAGAISRLLSTRIPQLLGELSYSIYMLHALVAWSLGVVLENIWPRIFGGVSTIEWMGLTLLGTTRIEGDVILLLYLAMTVFLSMLTYRLVESPGRRYFKTIARNWRESRVAKFQA